MNRSQRLRVAAKLVAVRALGRRVPIVVGWDITNRCNLRCAYCRQPEAEDAELTAAETLRCAREMASAGVEVVTLSGGEPLTRADLGDVVRTLSDAGVYVSLNTNGTLVTERPDVVKACGHVKVSVDGGPEVHDRIRGRGVYERAVRGLEAARSGGAKTTIGTVLSAHNVDRLDDVFRLAAETGSRVLFQPVTSVYSLGKAIDLPTPDPEAYRRAVDRIIREKLDTGRVVNSLPALRYMRGYPEGPAIRCWGGRGIGRLCADGTAVPCVTMRRTFRGQSVRDVSFAEAFRSIPAASCRTCFCSSTLDFNLLMKPDVGVLTSFVRRVGRR